MLDTRQLTGKQRQLIQQLQPHDTIASLRVHCQDIDVDFNFAKGFLLSGALTGYVQWHELRDTAWTLTEKGAALDGHVPGTELAERLKRNHELEALQTLLGRRFSREYGALRREQAVDMDTQEDARVVTVLRPAVLAAYVHRQALFTAIADGQPVPEDSPHLTWLEAQGWVAQSAEPDYHLTILPALQALELQPVLTTLTSDLLLSGQWREVELKPYHIHDAVPDVSYGRPAILTRCIHQIRDIFLNMGFDEMTGYLVESAFWNFDVLFTPQDHPAREVQDTFYLSQPQTLPLPADEELIQRVRQVHERSYGDRWTEAEASRAILRAHTTSSTARRLYCLEGKEGKYFSIDRVFRNETVDRTHLAEFHQIEGVVVGQLLSVRTLMGYLTYFYERLGFQQLKFKPTYNPYTEPSLEVYAYHPPSGRHIEVGNSGLFRPEMLEPLGCGGLSIIAWGLGLERIAMLLYGVEKLSDLVGPDIRL